MLLLNIITANSYRHTDHHNMQIGLPSLRMLYTPVRMGTSKAGPSRRLGIRKPHAQTHKHSRATKHKRLHHFPASSFKFLRRDIITINVTQNPASKGLRYMCICICIAPLLAVHFLRSACAISHPDSVRPRILKLLLRTRTLKPKARVPEDYGFYQITILHITLQCSTKT